MAWLIDVIEKAEFLQRLQNMDGVARAGELQGTEGRQSQLLGFYFRAYRALLPPHAPDMLTVRIQVIDGTGPVRLSALSAAHFPPPALPGFSGTTNLSASPGRPACPSRASGWSSLTTPWGLPCCVRFPCVHAVATTPAQRLGVLLRSFDPAVSAFPERVVGSTCASSFSRLARRSLALRPAHSRCHQFVTRYSERLQPFRHLHSCSGCFRLERLPGGTYTHWTAPPFHGAHP